MTALLWFYLLPMHASPLSAPADAPAWQRWLQSAPPTPNWSVPSTTAAWSARRSEIRATLLSLLGKFPARPAIPAVRVVRREDHGDFVEERFVFDNLLGAEVPGVILLPKRTAGPAPAILYCHWHGGHYEVGKEELFRTNAVPVPSGPALVRRGYVVLAIDACCFGERNGQGPGGAQDQGGGGESTASKFSLWMGRTLWGTIVRDDLMALDYLCSRPEVDARRIGVTGISMGATRTWWIMALDDRPQAGVAVCCMTRYQDLIASQGLRHHGIYYFVPGLLNHFDTEAVIALAAPRPLLFQSGELDPGSPVSGIHAIESAVQPVYHLYQRDAAFQSVVYPGVAHVYLPAMWEKTVRWLDDHLQPASPSAAGQQ